ncbi:SNF2 family N-terminal domain-containing protein [Jimgerdemannia flammicorona]|uniref:SNF2 family N-terminal domain-containing protein n=1 Tax=Jimgerdemannia flammicorona TaxID=994334 RepID=A0A433A178_9FUNG|nr:SNF2 family N-terminal domain-containing protein [Jimgerdemannia flammicorona]
MPPKSNEKAKKRNKCSNCGSFKHLSKNCPDLDLTTSEEDSEDDDVPEETNIVHQYKQQLQQKKAAGKQQKRRAPPSPKDSKDVDVSEETNVVHRPVELKRKASAIRKPQHKKRKTENKPITAEADTNFPWIDSVPIQSTSSRSRSAAITTTLPILAPSSSSSGVDVPDDFEDGATGVLPDADADDVAEDLVFGVVRAKIVGINYYDGMVSRGESVVIRREPHNPYDQNALRVDNMAAQQVSATSPVTSPPSFPPSLTATSSGLKVHPLPTIFLSHSHQPTLTPPSSPLRSTPTGTVTGSRTSYNIALKLSLLAATPILGQSLTTLLNSRGLRIESPNGAPSGAIVEFAAAEARAQNEWAQLLGRGQQMDQRKSQEVLGRIGMSELDLAKLPQAPQPAMVGTAMLSYQLQGLRFLVQQEHPLDPTKEAPVQFWTMRKDGQGEYYYNLVTNFATRKASDGVMGRNGYWVTVLGLGIRNEMRGLSRLSSFGCVSNLRRTETKSDDMGLGKTLQTISLIAGDPTGQGIVDNPTPSDKSYSDATLIVAPLSVIGNWVDQLAAHVSPARALKTYVFHGPDRNESPTFLAKHDVVVTTYNLLAQCDVSKKKGLFGVKWRRVVLDEGCVQ